MTPTAGGPSDLSEVGFFRGREVAVQNRRVEVEAVRPYDGAADGVNRHLGELGRVVEGLEHRVVMAAGEELEVP